MAKTDDAELARKLVQAGFKLRMGPPRPFGGRGRTEEESGGQMPEGTCGRRGEGGGFGPPPFERGEGGGPGFGRPPFDGREGEGGGFGPPPFERGEGGGPGFGRPPFDDREGEGGGFGPPPFRRGEGEGPGFGRPPFDGREEGGGFGPPPFRRGEGEGGMRAFGDFEGSGEESGSRAGGPPFERGGPRPRPMDRERILILLAKHPKGARQKDIAKEAGIAASSLSELIDKLESDGYVMRKNDPADRRATLLFLTAAGEARAAEAENERSERFRDCFRNLTAREKKTLSNLLDKILSQPDTM